MNPSLSQIRTTLSQKGPKETVKLLEVILEQDGSREEKSLLSHINIQMSNLKKRRIEGTLSYEESQITENTINKSLLDFIDQLEEGRSSATSKTEPSKKEKKDRTAFYIAMIGGAATIIAALIKVFPSLFPSNPQVAPEKETHLYTIQLQPQSPKIWDKGRIYLSFSTKDLGIDTLLPVTGDHSVTLESSESLGSRLLKLKLKGPEGYFLKDSLYQFIDGNKKTIQIYEKQKQNKEPEKKRTLPVTVKKYTYGELACLDGWEIIIDNKSYFQNFFIESGVHKVTIKDQFGTKTLLKDFEFNFPADSIRITKCRNTIEFTSL